MAEPTLAADYDDLKSRVGYGLGYGRGADAGADTWSDRQALDIDQCVRSGLNDFYHCGYEWSWLRPVVTLTLASGENTVILPDDVGGVEDHALFYSGGTNWVNVPIGGPGDVDTRTAADSTTTGIPRTACVERTGPPGVDGGERWRIRVWPTADQDYTLRVKCYVNPDMLSGSRPYHHGGAQHAQTVAAACLAAAEREIDGVVGEREAYFQKRLKASIDMDRRTKPQNLGPNLDRRESPVGGWWHDFGSNPATINGQVPA